MSSPAALESHGHSASERGRKPASADVHSRTPPQDHTVHLYPSTALQARASAQLWSKAFSQGCSLLAGSAASAAMELSRAVKLEAPLQVWGKGALGCGKPEETKPAPGPTGSLTPRCIYWRFRGLNTNFFSSDVLLWHQITCRNRSCFISVYWP